MSSIAALDRRCFLARSQARPRPPEDRCFLVGRVPLSPVTVPAPADPAQAERKAAPATA
jgi:hypothetical protein